MRSPLSCLRPALLLVVPALGSLPFAPAQAAPVICTTTLEAPLTAGGDRTPSAPVEVTRCGAVETTDALMQRRATRWRSTFARGVSLTHQITDILGIAMGGDDGTKVMGLGFPDQAIIWDASAIGNTSDALLEEQSSPIPWRSADLPSAFTSSLQEGAPGDATPLGGPAGVWTPPITTTPFSSFEPVRGLW